MTAADGRAHTTDGDRERALICPYCGGGLAIYTETVGPAYLTYETPESIQCRDCDATWEPDGTFREPARWIAFPDLYERPRA